VEVNGLGQHGVGVPFTPRQVPAVAFGVLESGVSLPEVGLLHNIASIQHTCCSTLRHVHSMAIIWGKATEHPVKKVRFAREDNGRVRVLSPDEEVQLLAHSSPQLKPLVFAVLHTDFAA